MLGFNPEKHVRMAIKDIRASYIQAARDLHLARENVATAQHLVKMKTQKAQRVYLRRLKKLKAALDLYQMMREKIYAWEECPDVIENQLAQECATLDLQAVLLLASALPREIKRVEARIEQMS